MKFNTPLTKITLNAEWYYVTCLSNFVKAYDKYSRHYSKSNIHQSTFPNKFFLLKENELEIGISKANKLIQKINLPGDRIIILKTKLAENLFFNDHSSGVAQYIKQNYIIVDSVYFRDSGSNKIKLRRVRLEEVTAKSFEILNPTLIPWSKLVPRTISLLPIAMACQASCKFCFSKSSVSSNFQGRIKDWERISKVLLKSKKAGAQRVVISGGGEPTLLRESELLRLIKLSSRDFEKVVLISNALILANQNSVKRNNSILKLDESGLSILAISRHHHESLQNSKIMGLDTKTEIVLESITSVRDKLSNLSTRLICVLQKEGISSVNDIEDYLTWSSQNGISQVNFKELYVSTSIESSFSNFASNEYSALNQVPLSIVHDFTVKHNWQQIDKLPWGSPIYQGIWNHQKMQIAAYTEPSVYWERTNGIVRSWNLMSDGTLLASLEDPKSQIVI